MVAECDGAVTKKAPNGSRERSQRARQQLCLRCTFCDTIEQQGKEPGHALFFLCRIAEKIDSQKMDATSMLRNKPV